MIFRLLTSAIFALTKSSTLSISGFCLFAGGDGAVGVVEAGWTMGWA